jgi:uncharacterized protein YhdP
VIPVDRFRPVLQAALARELGKPVLLGPLKLSLWTGVALRTDRLEIGDLEHGRLVAGPVRLRPALLPFLRGSVDLRGIVGEHVEIESARGRLLREGSLRARFAQQGGGDFEVAGRLRGTWAVLPGAPSGTLTVECAKRGSRLDLDRLGIEAGATRLDLKAKADGVGTGRARWQVEGSGRGPTSEGAGRATLLLSPEAPRLELSLDFVRLDPAELAALAGWASAGATAAQPASPVVGGAPPSPFLARLQGGGTLRAQWARLAGLDVENLSTVVELGGGTIRLRDATFGLYGGRHRGTLTLSAVQAGMPFLLQSRVDGVDVARLLAAWSPGSAGVLRGRGAVDLDLQGVAYAPEKLRTLEGGVHLTVSDGALTTVGLLETVAALLEAAGGRGIGKDETPFRSLAGDFAVQTGVAHTENLALVADDLRLDVRGDVDLTGPLALEGVVAFSPQASASMVQRTGALRVRQGPDGRLTVPLTVRGSLRTPKVQVDVQRIVREGLRDETRKDLEREVERAKKRLLDRLLR